MEVPKPPDKDTVAKDIAAILKKTREPMTEKEFSIYRQRHSHEKTIEKLVTQNTNELRLYKIIHAVEQKSRQDDLEADHKNWEDAYDSHTKIKKQKAHWQLEEKKVKDSIEVKCNEFKRQLDDEITAKQNEIQAKEDELKQYIQAEQLKLKQYVKAKQLEIQQHNQAKQLEIQERKAGVTTLQDAKPGRNVRPKL